jgi:diguanylate cyclase (GGDEF)-like protein
MTRLYNKTYVQHIIIEEMEKSDENSYAAMLIIDIDNFKYINDMYGHLIGDKVIVEFANRLLEATREDDIVGRVGGDEFIVYIKSISSKDALKHKLQRLISNLEFQFVEQEVNTHICCSIGATLFNSKSTDYIEAYKKADSSLYLAKDNGKNTYRLYD